MEIRNVKAYGTEAVDVPLHKMSIKRRELLPHDVEMELLYCGICHADLHQIKNDFGGTMGAHIVVFTSSPSEVEDAKRLGAHEAVLSTDPEQLKKYSRSLHFILDTVSAKHDVNAYLNLLRHDGSVVLVGLPPEPPEIGAFNIVMGRRSLSDSNIGSISETQEMLDFCAQHNITADIELIDIQHIKEAFDRLEKGDVKYRFVIDMASLKDK
jgi:uncharacterized zinc-type alcohol dehydrogenase-like protein